MGSVLHCKSIIKASVITCTSNWDLSLLITDVAVSLACVTRDVLRLRGG